MLLKLDVRRLTYMPDGLGAVSSGNDKGIKKSVPTTDFFILGP